MVRGGQVPTHYMWQKSYWNPGSEHKIMTKQNFFVVIFSANKQEKELALLVLIIFSSIQPFDIQSVSFEREQWRTMKS